MAILPLRFHVCLSRFVSEGKKEPSVGRVQTAQDCHCQRCVRHNVRSVDGMCYVFAASHYENYESLRNRSAVTEAGAFGVLRRKTTTALPFVLFPFSFLSLSFRVLVSAIIDFIYFVSPTGRKDYDAMEIPSLISSFLEGVVNEQYCK